MPRRTERRGEESDGSWTNHGPAVAPLWSVWHFQTTTTELGSENRDLPHLLIGFFASEPHAEDVVARLRRASGLRDWPAGFRVWQDSLDGGGAWEQGFIDPWDDGPPVVDPDDVMHLPDPMPALLPVQVWNVRHFKVYADTAPPAPQSAKGIGLFSTLANAEAAVAHRRRQPGFRDWPQGFRIFRRRLGVAFGLDGFQERYGWEAWRDSLRG